MVNTAWKMIYDLIWVAHVCAADIPVEAQNVERLQTSYRGREML